MKESLRVELDRRTLLNRGLSSLVLLGYSIHCGQHVVVGSTQDAQDSGAQVPQNEGKGVGYFAPRKLDMKFGMKFN
jgi:hypothetical protein